MGSKDNQSARSAYWVVALFAAGVGLGGFALEQAWAAPEMDTSESVVHYHPVAQEKKILEGSQATASKNVRTRTLNIGGANAELTPNAPVPGKKLLGKNTMEMGLKTPSRSLPGLPHQPAKAFMAKTKFPLPKNASKLSNLNQLKASSPSMASSTVPAWEPIGRSASAVAHPLRRNTARTARAATHKTAVAQNVALNPVKQPVNPVEASQSAKNTAPEHIEVLEPEAPNDSAANELSSEPSNTDAMPLDLSGKAQRGTSQASTRMLLRITISLLVVLGLFVGFAKMLLPRLMARYPQLFERLRSRQPTGGPSWEPPPAEQRGFNFFRTTQPDPTTPSNQKQYLERVDLNGNRFNVKSTTRLGHGKELHLVEILGRQLVVATTPYSVTLIKDLTGGENDSSSSNSQNLSAQLRPEISGFLSGGLHEQASSTSESIETDDFYNPSWREKSSVNQSLRQPEPYAQTSLQEGPVYSPVEPAEEAAYHKPLRSFASLPEPNPLDALYLKYLDGSDRGPSWRKSQFLPGNGPKDSYVDAEEVVVLEDYDDFYGR